MFDLDGYNCLVCIYTPMQSDVSDKLHNCNLPTESSLSAMQCNVGIAVNIFPREMRNTTSERKRMYFNTYENTYAHKNNNLGLLLGVEDTNEIKQWRVKGQKNEQDNKKQRVYKAVFYCDVSVSSTPRGSTTLIYRCNTGVIPVHYKTMGHLHSNAELQATLSTA